MSGWCSTCEWGIMRMPTCSSTLLPRRTPTGTGGVSVGVSKRASAILLFTERWKVSVRARDASGVYEEEEQRQRLTKGIADFYDSASGLWESIWGEHMHHGFYHPNTNTHSHSLLSDHRTAQLRMIDEALRFARIPEDPMQRPRSIVDVGCGIGGSSRYLARKFDAQCQGITLSPVQAQRAEALAASQGLADKVSFQVADALNQPFPGAQFDLVWSMESGEHMPDKEKDIKAADWSEYVAPFWPAVISTALTWKGFISLLRSGWKPIRGALVMPLMIQGYKMGLIKFAIITCRKPL